jgi:hypothetical protein
MAEIPESVGHQVVVPESEEGEWGEEEERQYLKGVVHALSRPRLSGSAGALITELTLRDHFESLGYRIEEDPFSFSTWPGRFTVPLVGAGYLILTLAATSLLLRERRSSALATLLAVPPLLGGLAGVASYLVPSLPYGRIQTSNWIVSRPGVRPRYLVMAHRDSKSQPISTAGRTGAAVVALLAWAGLVMLALAQPRRRGRRTQKKVVTRVTGLLAIGTGCILTRSRVGNESPGALDNASGLSALVGIARRERVSDDVAFLITDGEELWLAGARAAALRLPANVGVINLDGLDDNGKFYLIDQIGRPPRSIAPWLTEAFIGSAAELGIEIIRRDLPLGILLDHIPLARAGHPAISLLHGGRHSLRRVHRPTDHPGELSCAGVVGAVRLVCNALRLARGRAAHEAISSARSIAP